MNCEDYGMEKIKCFWFCFVVVMFYVLDVVFVIDLNFNIDDFGFNFFIFEYIIK